MRVFFFFVLLVSTGHCESMWLMLDASGVVVGGKGVKSDNLAMEFPGAASQVQGSLPLRQLEDELHVPGWRWNGSTFERRKPADVAADRRRALLPHLIDRKQKLDAAKALQSADPSSVTTADVQAIQAELDKAKAAK